jgi:hypothetical protein
VTSCCSRISLRSLLLDLAGAFISCGGSRSVQSRSMVEGVCIAQEHNEEQKYNEQGDVSRT